MKYLVVVGAGGMGRTMFDLSLYTSDAADE